MQKRALLAALCAAIVLQSVATMLIISAGGRGGVAITATTVYDGDC